LIALIHRLSETPVMSTCRTAIYVLVAAASLVLAGVQAISSSGDELEASAIGLGQGVSGATLPSPSRH